MHHARRLMPALISAALLAACAGDGSPTGPGIDGPAGATGTIALTMRADGPALDPDGYTVRVGGVDRGEVAVKGTTWIRGVAAGGTELSLGDVDAGCTVAGGNPRTIAVPAGEVVRVAVNVECSTPPGAAAP